MNNNFGGQAKEKEDNLSVAKKTISERWMELDQIKHRHSNDLKHILNFNEGPTQGYMYKRGLSNKNISTATKVKRISTKFLREKKAAERVHPKYQNLAALNKINNNQAKLFVGPKTKVYN